MSQAILPGQSSTPPTNVTIPTIPFTCLKGLHGNCMRHCWGTTTRGDKEPQTEKISNLKATQGPKAPAPHAATPPEATPERERCTRYGTMHPIRGTAPDQKRCIAYGSGAAPQHTRTNAELAHRTTHRHTPPCATGPNWRQDGHAAHAATCTPTHSGPLRHLLHPYMRRAPKPGARKSPKRDSLSGQSNRIE